MTELIKGTYIGTDKGQPHTFTYISEFSDYQALIDDFTKKLDVKTWGWENKVFDAFVKEFKQQIRGNDKEILPVLYDLGYLSAAGYVVVGKTTANDLISVDLRESSDGDFTYHCIRFAEHKPGTDLRKILTDFSKNPNYLGSFKGKFFRINSSIDKILDTNVLSSVSVNNYRSGWEHEGNSPLITQAYTNLSAKLPAEK
jgi:hypothetical protein